MQQKLHARFVTLTYSVDERNNAGMKRKTHATIYALYMLIFRPRSHGTGFVWSRLYTGYLSNVNSS